MLRWHQSEDRSQAVKILTQPRTVTATVSCQALKEGSSPARRPIGLLVSLFLSSVSSLPSPLPICIYITSLPFLSLAFVFSGNGVEGT